MANMKLVKITCPYCEGTQRTLNHFDPLEQQLPGRYVIDREERAPSGRTMYGWKCEACKDGKVFVPDLIASSLN